MSDLLFLAHRIPYPPDKGDKIRSWHLLRHLAARHRVHLGAFVDQARDWPYRSDLERVCASVNLEPLASGWKRGALVAQGLVQNAALSVACYRSRPMRAWVDRIVATCNITHAVVFSSTMAQYVTGEAHGRLRRIADFCDVDSDKWRQYAQGRRAPMRQVYAREGVRLLAYERRIATSFDSVLFATAAEAALFRSLAPEVAGRVGHFDNGVDTCYFDPGLAFDSPYPAPEGPVVVFTGAMDYWANEDAVRWFAEMAWPLVRERAAAAQFWIVGSNPTAGVKALERLPGVRVTGRVPDVRPYLAYAAVAVAPLRIARGTQNKVLEALAMALPVACTSAAASGLDLAADPAFRVADRGEDLARAVIELIGVGRNASGREAVLARYSWEANLATVDRIVGGENPGLGAEVPR